MDPLVISFILELFEDDLWIDKVLHRLSFTFIPMANPDGFAHMMQGSNVNNINFHWKFFGNSKEDCPEAYSIWRYCMSIKPVFFMDFHMFTFQNFERRAYTIPPLYLPSRKLRRLQDSINKELSELCRVQNLNALILLS